MSYKWSTQQVFNLRVMSVCTRSSYLVRLSNSNERLKDMQTEASANNVCFPVVDYPTFRSYFDFPNLVSPIWSSMFHFLLFICCSLLFPARNLISRYPRPRLNKKKPRYLRLLILCQSLVTKSIWTFTTPLVPK